MENASYGVGPNDELDTIMSDIEKYTQEEKDNDNLEEPEGKDYIDPRVDNIEDPAEQEVTEEEEPVEKTEVAEEEETFNEAELFKDKYYAEKKKRKSLYADRQNLEDENKELKKILGGTMNTNAELYGRDLYNDLEKIKNIKKQALLGEDADLLLEADEIYQRTLYKINEFESSHARNASHSNDQDDIGSAHDRSNYQEQLEQQELARKSQEWLQDRPELVEGSSKFNPKIQRELAEFIEQFDYELRRNGREDEILSDAYLDVLDEYVDKVKVNPKKDGYTTSKVGGVRNNFSNNTPGTSTRVTLTAFDKNYAKNLGISEKEYLKYKIEDMKESRNSR